MAVRSSGMSKRHAYSPTGCCSSAAAAAARTGSGAPALGWPADRLTRSP